MKVFCVFILFIVFVHTRSTPSEFETHDDSWVNVNDPLSWDQPAEKPRNEHQPQCVVGDQDLMNCQQKVIELEQELEKSQTKPVDVLLKHIIHQFLNKLNVELADGLTVYKEAKVTLSAKDVRVLMRYLGSSSDSEEISLREDVRSSLSDFLTDVDSETPWLVQRLQRFIHYILILNLAILPAAFIYLLKQAVGLRSFLVLLVTAMFCVSLGFTYLRKYKEVVAERFTRISPNDDQCSPKGLLHDVGEVLLGYLRIKGKSECLKKYEDVLIDPIYLIDPLQVVGEVMTTFLMSPLTIGGVHLNKFFNDFFVDTPLPLVIVKVVFLLLLLFFATGYRLRTLLWTLEPTAPARIALAGEVQTVSLRKPIKECRSEPVLPIETLQEETIERLAVGNCGDGPQPQPADRKPEVDLDAQLWFHRISYEQSERLLQAATVGQWLARESESKPGHLALSVRGFSRTRHFIVERSPFGVLRLGSRTFPTLAELVSHYSELAIAVDQEKPITLKKPLERSQPDPITSHPMQT